MSVIQRITKLSQRGHAEAGAALNSAKFRRQRGASAIEYVIIAAVIAFAIFLAAGAIGGGEGIQGAFQGFFERVAEIIGDSTEEG